MFALLKRGSIFKRHEKSEETCNFRSTRK